VLPFGDRIGAARLAGYGRAVRWPLLAYLPAAVAYARTRRKLGAPAYLSLPLVALAPLAPALALPRGRFRSAAIWATQMWAYKVAFEVPHDRPERHRERLHIDYPIEADTVIGRGAPPGVRLQRRLRHPPRLSWLDRAVSALYFTWELEPHAAMLWVLLRHPERWPGCAGRLGATFDLTLLGYFAWPTAPPWWASEREDRMGHSVRRVVAEAGKELRAKPRPGVDHYVGTNPWAAMPSDHFASAVMTAMVLAGVDRRAGAAAGAYATALGFVLVYAGEHYVVDLIAGLCLAVAVRLVAPAVAGPASRVGTVLARLAPDPA
jgi:membrane-associated phospholipid phosphatase